MKAKQAIIFKLSNLVYQAVFQDKSEVLLSSKLPSVLYIDKDRKRHHYQLNSDEIQKHRSINVRIEYFKKVLRKWVERDSNTTNTASVSKSKPRSPSQPRVGRINALINLLQIITSMGLFDSLKKGDSNELPKVLKNEILVRGKYPHCVRECLGEDLLGAMNDSQKVCLAICVDKLHLRYEPFIHDIAKAIRQTAAPKAT